MHAEAMACTGSRRRRNCREHKAQLSSRIFRLQRTFSLRLHAKRPISPMSQMKGNPMVPKMKNQNHVVATRPVQVPVSLRDVHDRASDPRRQAALRRLERLFEAPPLESLPADVDRFDACFPPGGFGGPDMPWISERAYRHWRSFVRSTIHRHLVALGTSVMQVRQVQSDRLSRTTAQHHTAIPASEVLRHAGINFARASHANFRKAASDPKSD